MAGSRSSLPPRGLLALIAGVTVIPLGTLLWLGWQLLEQDRALEAQQAQQRLERAADLVAGALERSVATWEQQMSSGSDALPAGVVSLMIRGGDVALAPRARVAFLPVLMFGGDTWPINTCQPAAGALFDAPGTTKLQIARLPGGDTYVLQAPPGSIARLFDYRNTFAPVDKGLCRFDFVVTLSPKPKKGRP